MLTVAELKNLFLKYSFRPLKRLGENYLIDANIKDKIISRAGISGKDTVLEIGPGFGALTMDLSASGAEVYAVEKDKKAFAILKELAGDRFPNLKLINGDILKFDIGGTIGNKRIKVIGNLPYYITSPIIEYIIGNKRSVRSALIMVQKEVASRILAGAGTKEYSSLSCFVRYHTNARYIHTIKRSSYYPEPEVDSSLIELAILDKPSVDVKDEELLFRIIRGSFNQRRKSIINSLSRKEVLDKPKAEIAAILGRAGIDPSARPETLGLAEFARLANLF
ncbi:MAG: ribosomal RNA small subunit methyltransferase A [Candidatus Omnitrophica bacterium]|nr:ribosomal RNA small subunit methyltransferase A [Candidatus Omnitrophota bacterium]